MFVALERCLEFGAHGLVEGHVVVLIPSLLLLQLIVLSIGAPQLFPQLQHIAFLIIEDFALNDFSDAPQIKLAKLVDQLGHSAFVW